MTKKWMSGAVKKPGALRETAKRDGLIKGGEPARYTGLSTW